MWTNTFAATTFALIWLLIVLGFFLREPKAISQHRFLGSAFGIIAIALVVRAVPTILLPVGAGYDIDSFRMVGEAYVNGEEIYKASVGRHPYLPFQLHIVGWSYWVSKISGLPFVIALKAPLIVADSLLAGLIVYVLAKEENQHQAIDLGLMYALNPAVIFVSAYHGQFESVTLLLLFSAWLTWYLHRDTLKVGSLLGLAILNKTWPIVFFPVLFLRLRDWRERVTLTGLAFGIPTVFTLLYLWWFSAPPDVILARALTHTGNSGWWGATALLFVGGEYFPSLMTLFDSFHLWRRWLLLFAGLAGLLATRRQPVLSALITIILLEFAVTAGIGVQWVVWLIPFAIVEKDLFWMKLYTVGATIFLIGQNYGMHMYDWAGILFGHPLGLTMVRLSSIPVWIIVVMWLVVRLHRARVVVETDDEIL